MVKIMNITQNLKLVLISLILIIAALITANPVSAAITETTNTGKISVSNIESGVKVDLYRLATVNYSYVADQPLDTAYSWINPIQEWIDQKYPNYSNPEVFYEEIENMSEDSKAFYDELTSAIKNNTISVDVYDSKTATGTATYPVTEENLTGNVSFEHVEMGVYLTLIENGYMVYTPSIVNLVPEFDEASKQWILNNQEVTIKATNPSITKTVTDGNLSADNYSTIDTIPYSIIADVPTYLPNSLSKNYYISDLLSKSLTLNKESIKIYGINGNSKTLLTTEFTIEYNIARPNTSDEMTFVINFNYENIKKYEKIEIDYTASLNQDNSLILGASGNTNIAYLDYSNNPYDTTSMQTQKDEGISVFTYGISVVKVDKKDFSQKLSGAEFTLSDNSGNILYFVKQADGVYYLSTKTEKNATSNLVVDANGKLCLYGLDEGIFNLTETHAPDNYNLSTSPYTIKIVDKNCDGKLDDDSSDSGIYSIIFPNTHSFVLPLTGGNAVLFIVAVTIIFCGLLIFVKSGDSKEETKKQ